MSTNYQGEKRQQEYCVSSLLLFGILLFIYWASFHVYFSVGLLGFFCLFVSFFSSGILSICHNDNKYGQIDDN